METNRSLQFEFKLLTKFLLRIQPDCQTSAHPTHDYALFAKSPKADYMPASKAVRLLSKHPSQTTALYGSVRLQPEIFNYCRNYSIAGYRGKSERTSSERGLSGLQSEETSYYKASLPRLAANPTQTAQSTSAINYSSRLMFAAQGAFHSFLLSGENPLRCGRSGHYFFQRQN